MNKPLILLATSVLTSFTMLHFPSAAQEETSRLTSYREYLTQRGGLDYRTRPPEYDRPFERPNPVLTRPPETVTNILVPHDRPFVRPNPVLHQERPSDSTTSSTAQTRVEGIAPLQTFRISNDIFNKNVLGDSIDEARYRKPNAYEAEFADVAEEAAFAFSALEADFATNAAVAVRVEEKAPYGQAWDFGLTQVNRGSRTFTQHYDRPEHADSVLINANCITAGEKGDLSRVIISFDAVFTRTVSLCEAGRTSGTSEYNRGYNSVNLDVPQGVGSLTVTQYVDKDNNGGTAITDGFVQWFGPHSLASNATRPTAGDNITTTPPPPPPAPAPTPPAPAPTTGGGLPFDFCLSPRGPLTPSCREPETIYIGDGECHFAEPFVYDNSPDCAISTEPEPAPTTQSQYFCASLDFGRCTPQLDAFANSGLVFPRVGNDTKLVCVGVGLDGPGIVPTRLDCINSDGVPYRKVG